MIFEPMFKVNTDEKQFTTFADTQNKLLFALFPQDIFGHDKPLGTARSIDPSYSEEFVFSEAGYGEKAGEDKQ